MRKCIGSSQSRAAKTEAAASSVSVDLLVGLLIALGMTREDLARVIACGSAAGRWILTDG